MDIWSKSLSSRIPAKFFNLPISLSISPAVRALFSFASPFSFLVPVLPSFGFSFSWFAFSFPCQLRNSGHIVIYKLDWKLFIMKNNYSEFLTFLASFENNCYFKTLYISCAVDSVEVNSYLTTLWSCNIKEFLNKYLFSVIWYLS